MNKEMTLTKVEDTPTKRKYERKLVRDNYIVNLQSDIYDRVQQYDPSIVSNKDKNSMYIHIRAIISMYLKKDTGEGIKKGNNVLDRETYDRCVSYLDKILPKL